MKRINIQTDIQKNNNYNTTAFKMTVRIKMSVVKRVILVMILRIIQ